MNGLITTTDRLVLASGERAARLWSGQAVPLGVLMLALFAAALAASGLFVPKSNWDMFAYLASAHEAPGMSAQELHDFAYGAMKEAIPPGEFTVLTEDRDYRIRQHADAEAFATMLGFYKVKWLYIEVIRGLSGFMDSVSAIRFISAFSAAGAALLSIVWLWSRRALHLAPLALAAMVFVDLGEMARVGTPDAFSLVLFVAGMLAFLHRREALTAVLLFLAFLARPDHAAYIGVLFVVSIFMRSFSWGALAAFAAAAVAYVPVTQAAGHPGWWVQMWFTHVEYVGTLEGFDPPVSVVTYLKIVVRVLVRSVIEESWLAVLIVAAAAWWQMLQHHVEFTRREATLLVATVVAFAAKFVVMPLHQDRFYSAYLLVFCLTLIGAMASVRFAAPAVLAREVADDRA